MNVISIMNAIPMAWDLGSFLKNSATTIKTWGGYAITLIGVVMIIVAVFKIASGLISHGKTQVSWPVAIILFVLGGAFMVGGFSFVAEIAGDSKKTIDDLGKGATQTIIPMLTMFKR